MKKFSAKFFVRTSSENVTEGKIYCRLRMNGQYIDFSINRKVEMKEWNADIGWPTGKKLQTKELQKYLHTIQEKLFEKERILFESKEELNVKSLAADFLNTKKVETQELTIIDLIELHNSRAKEELQSNLIVKATYLKYITTKRYVAEFSQELYKKQGIALSKLNLDFLIEFEHWLKTQKKCCQNTTNKYIKALKKVVNMGIDRGILKADPFRAFKIKNVHVNRSCLNLSELRLLENYETTIERIQRVKDYFLFSCYTGLSYGDVVSLRQTDISKDGAGDLWIQKERQKTGVLSRVPLIKKASALIDKYNAPPLRKYRDTIFPPISNQKLNAYLKEIADLNGIQKKLTFHIARHTFATTVTLANGVSLESVSAALGHTNIKQTQHYAKMTNQRIKTEMNLIEGIV